MLAKPENPWDQFGAMTVSEEEEAVQAEQDAFPDMEEADYE